MKYLRIRHFSLFLSFLFLAFFFSLFGVSSAFALDETYTLDGESNSTFFICGLATDQSCNITSAYIKVESDLSVCSSNSNLYISMVDDSSPQLYSFGSCGTVFIPTASFPDIVSLRFQIWRTNGSGTISISTVDSIGSACPSCPVIDGTLSITENGTFDVSSYQFASVDVPPEPGDYDDELNNIYRAIITIGAVAFALYFFYVIYGLLIRSSKR